MGCGTQPREPISLVTDDAPMTSLAGVGSGAAISIGLRISVRNHTKRRNRKQPNQDIMISSDDIIMSAHQPLRPATRLDVPLMRQ